MGCIAMGQSDQQPDLLHPRWVGLPLRARENIALHGECNILPIRYDYPIVCGESRRQGGHKST
jgi:hypothetical protein